VINLRELLTGKARLVAHVDRFAGTPVHRRETVAEHSYMTAQYALFIGLHCIEKGGNVNMARLLARAIVHDLDEAVMVDLPRPIKYADEELRARWQVLCHAAVQDMERALGVKFFHTWLTAKDGSLDGMILAFADLISVTSYVIEEIKFGNTFMIPVLEGNLTYLHKFYNHDRQSTELRELILTVINIAGTFLPETSNYHVPVETDR
jgi:5'-deoxynucleotidase YfbR-like HD superfamily hydrolase